MIRLCLMQVHDSVCGYVPISFRALKPNTIKEMIYRTLLAMDGSSFRPKFMFSYVFFFQILVPQIFLYLFLFHSNNLGIL